MLELSCPWTENRDVKIQEKLIKHVPLTWELKQRYQGYTVEQYNVIIDVSGGWSKDLARVFHAKDARKKREEIVSEYAEGCHLQLPEHWSNF